MKVCPNCQTRYEQGEAFCPNDGTELVDARELSPGELTGTDLGDTVHLDELDFSTEIGERYFGRLSTNADTPVSVTVLDDDVVDASVETSGLLETLQQPLPPEILAVHSVEFDDHSWVVEQPSSGSTLAAELEDRRNFDWRLAVRIAVRLARLLQWMLDQGHAHPGLHPGAIYLTDDETGRLQVGDWVQSKLAVPSTPENAALEENFAGFVSYMAPERASGEPADSRTLVYAIGMLLYELILGKPPFTSNNPVETLDRHQNEKPLKLGIAVGGDDYNSDLDAILERTWDKDPDERFQSPGALIGALSSLLNDSPDELAPELKPADAPYFDLSEPADDPSDAEQSAEVEETADSPQQEVADASANETLIGMPSAGSDAAQEAVGQGTAEAVDESSSHSGESGGDQEDGGEAGGEDEQDQTAQTGESTTTDDADDETSDETVDAEEAETGDEDEPDASDQDADESDDPVQMGESSIADDDSDNKRVATGEMPSIIVEDSELSSAMRPPEAASDGEELVVDADSDFGEWQNSLGTSVTSGAKDAVVMRGFVDSESDEHHDADGNVTPVEAGKLTSTDDAASDESTDDEDERESTASEDADLQEQSAPDEDDADETSTEDSSDGWDAIAAQLEDDEDDETDEDAPEDASEAESDDIVVVDEEDTDEDADETADEPSEEDEEIVPLDEDDENVDQIDEDVEEIDEDEEDDDGMVTGEVTIAGADDEEEKADESAVEAGSGEDTADEEAADAEADEDGNDEDVTVLDDESDIVTLDDDSEEPPEHPEHDTDDEAAAEDDETNKASRSDDDLDVGFVEAAGDGADEDIEDGWFDQDLEETYIQQEVREDLDRSRKIRKYVTWGAVAFLCVVATAIIIWSESTGGGESDADAKNGKPPAEQKAAPPADKE